MQYSRLVSLLEEKVSQRKANQELIWYSASEEREICDSVICHLIESSLVKPELQYTTFRQFGPWCYQMNNNP